MVQMERNYKTAFFGFLITVDVILLASAALALLVPIQDYALHEYRIWLSSPSTQSWKAFQDKKRKEVEIRTEVTFVLALAGGSLALFILHKRS